MTINGFISEPSNHLFHLPTDEAKGVTSVLEEIEGIILTVLYAITMLVTFAGNGFLIYIVWKKPEEQLPGDSRTLYTILLKFDKKSLTTDEAKSMTSVLEEIEGIILTVLYAITMLVAFVGNGFLIYIVWKKPERAVRRIYKLLLKKDDFSGFYLDEDVEVVTTEYLVDGALFIRKAADELEKFILVGRFNIKYLEKSCAKLWLPANVVHMIFVMQAWNIEVTPQPIVMFVCFWFGHANSAINPWLYIFPSTKIDTAFKRMVCRETRQSPPSNSVITSNAFLPPEQETVKEESRL
ncbi:hypothetical protein AWC38_SpisGene6914 [Stylophora pistillata]|uniref:G-protein coupled receptors family 1 profile domain-containing protein n=1 Tax=Stylophora pistillata TaxID=50429 RepID=A0A2B4SCH8_STYPI|nr:hypothetical protein AWC38_SpisGene6914 [Stylophora pistillata]